MLTHLTNLLCKRGFEKYIGVACASASATSSTSSGEKTLVPPRPKVPATTTPADKVLRFDQKTHTGQAWDEEDIRLARFTATSKQVNPNIAMHLIAEVPPQACHDRVVSCDGGGGALGHPKIYLNLDKPGNHACGYCGLRFYLEGQDHDGSEHIQV